MFEKPVAHDRDKDSCLLLQLLLRQNDNNGSSSINSRLYQAVSTYACTFFSPNTFVRNTASCPLILLASARSNLAPSANLLISSVFWSFSAYRCCTRRLSSRRSNPAFHDLMSDDLGSPAVELAPERCEGAMEGVSVAAL